ncbi:MAG: hypothetical protein PSV13_00735 [Lacunisphaera sp.]|nr:hypothetical protein [Lacunisphaera sp.]
MSGSDSHRIPPNRVGLSLVLLLVAWLVISYYPRDKTPPPVDAPPVVESKLRAVGLRDNPDWDGLPEFFAIWAERAEWSEGKTRFAYWHPVMKTYSYYFEAVRTGDAYRFKEIGEPNDPDHVWDESLGEDSPIRFYHSAEIKIPKPRTRAHTHGIRLDPPGKVELNLTAPKIPVPETKVTPEKIPPKP